MAECVNYELVEEVEVKALLVVPLRVKPLELEETKDELDTVVETTWLLIDWVDVAGVKIKFKSFSVLLLVVVEVVLVLVVIVPLAWLLLSANCIEIGVELEILFCKKLFVLIITICGLFKMGDRIWVRIWPDWMLDILFNAGLFIWDIFMILNGWFDVFMMLLTRDIGFAGLTVEVVVEVGVFVPFIGFMITNFLGKFGNDVEVEDGIVVDVLSVVLFVSSLTFFGLLV